MITCSFNKILNHLPIKQMFLKHVKISLNIRTNITSTMNKTPIFPAKAKFMPIPNASQVALNLFSGIKNPYMNTPIAASAIRVQ